MARVVQDRGVGRLLETVEPGVSLKRMPRFRVVYVTHSGPADEMGVAFRRLIRLLREWRIHPTGPMLAVHHGEPGGEGHGKDGVDAAAIVGDDTKARGELMVRDFPACDVASLVYDGPPARYADSFVQLRHWMKANGYERAGSFREVYARDLSDLPPGILYAEVQVPVRRARPA